MKKKLVLGIAKGNEHAFYTFHGSRDLALIPASETGFDTDLPVRLQLGNRSWGVEHIRLRHGIWLTKIRRTVPELLYDKMHQCGNIYTGENKNKVNIQMKLSPASLLVFRKVTRDGESFLSLTTAFNNSSRVDGEHVGRYISDFICV